MAEYDGSIRINTKIYSKEASAQFMTLQNRIVKTADKIASLRSKMDALKDAQVPTQAYKDLEKELANAEKEMQKMLAQDIKIAGLDAKIEKLTQSTANYAAKMRELETKQIPTQEYEMLDKELAKLGAEYDRLAEKQHRFLETGGKEDSRIYRTMEYDLDKIDKKQDAVKAQMQQLVEEGRAFRLGSGTEEYQNLLEQYRAVNQELEKAKALRSEISTQQAESVQKVLELKAQVQQLVEEGRAFRLGSETEEYANLVQQLRYLENELATLNQRHRELENEQNRNIDGYKRIGRVARDSAGKVNESIKSMSDSLKLGFKNILKYGLGIRSLYALINKIRMGIKEGFSNFYNYSDSFKASADGLKASLLTLKNSFAAAFAPLVQMVIPYIQRAIEYITRLVNIVGQFIAAISGQKTYTKAIKQTTAAIKEQNKASNKQLSSLDKLNNLTSDTGGVDDDGGAGAMFEEAPIDKGILDFLQKIKDFLKPIIDYAQKLKDVFMQGFWDGLGDWEYRWDSIKDSLASIKDSLINIWTDPVVLAAADNWAQSVAYMLGSLVGSIESIGLTIAANLFGGIALYFEQNKERIKKYLISMFDIWAEINYLFADFFQSIAYVFEAFASEQGQQLTANIIGIFSDTFMGITELASKLFRDIANIIIQPFVDNKEAFRTALEGFLGVLAEVIGTIKDGIDATFDKLNEVYDEHIKPFFDSVAQGMSDLTASFLEFWNNNVQPMLDDWARKFDTLWKEHIQPAIDKIIDAFGKVFDSLKKLWDEVIVPLADWIIANLLPILLPIIDTIFNESMDLIGVMFDLIGDLANIIGDCVKLVVDLLTGDWSAAWNDAKAIVKGVWDSIIRIISNAVGKIEGFVNKIMGLFGKAELKGKSLPNSGGGLGGAMGGALSGKSSAYSLNSAMASLSTAEIPAYATGQVIPRTMRQHLAILGDNSRETEVVSPLSTMKQAMIEALAEVGMASGSGGSGQDINLNLTVECEGYQLLNIMRKLDREYFKQTGKHALA